ncbi:MAG TPA: hypothetical protein VHA79_04710 [Mycobacteriales bacterium]|nr:hypothetical protein [Mycobacteriales bacterium]
MSAEVEAEQEQPAPRGRPLLIATYVVLGCVGVLMATIEAFLVPQRLMGGVEGLSALLAVLGNLAVGLLGGRGTVTTAGAVAPAVGWFAGIATVTVVAPGGDVVIPGGLPADPGVVVVGMVTLLGGLLASIVPIALTSRYTARVNRPKGDS